jgi:hypothetical protein
MNPFPPTFPDLTEVHGVTTTASGKENPKVARYGLSYSDPDYYSKLYLPYSDDMIKTEFAFAVSSPGEGWKEGAGKCGYKPIACKNNWYQGHWGQERALTFLWKKLEGKPNVPGAKREYGWAGFKSRITQGGCGFKVGEPPLRRLDYFRYFTLLRLPIEPTIFQARWLKAYGFNLVDVGTLSSYYVNGWKPEEYSWKLEKKVCGDWPAREHSSLRTHEFGG